MSSTIYYDDLIRDYLLYRGFTATLKAFEAELKADKDKGFRMEGEASCTGQQSNEIDNDEQLKDVEKMSDENEDQNYVNTCGIDNNEACSSHTGEGSEAQSEESANSDSEEDDLEDGDTMYDPEAPFYHQSYRPEYRSCSNKYRTVSEKYCSDDKGNRKSNSNRDLILAILEESQQIQEALRNFADNVNHRLVSLENSLLDLKSGLKGDLMAKTNDANEESEMCIEEQFLAFPTNSIPSEHGSITIKTSPSQAYIENRRSNIIEAIASEDNVRLQASDDAMLVEANGVSAESGLASNDNNKRENIIGAHDNSGQATEVSKKTLTENTDPDVGTAAKNESVLAVQHNPKSVSPGVVLLEQTVKITEEANCASQSKGIVIPTNIQGELVFRLKKEADVCGGQASKDVGTAVSSMNQNLPASCPVAFAPEAEVQIIVAGPRGSQAVKDPRTVGGNMNQNFSTSCPVAVAPALKEAEVQIVYAGSQCSQAHKDPRTIRPSGRTIQNFSRNCPTAAVGAPKPPVNQPHTFMPQIQTASVNAPSPRSALKQNSSDKNQFLQMPTAKKQLPNNNDEQVNKKCRIFAPNVQQQQLPVNTGGRPSANVWIQELPLNTGGRPSVNVWMQAPATMQQQQQHATSVYMQHMLQQPNTTKLRENSWRHPATAMHEHQRLAGVQLQSRKPPVSFVQQQQSATKVRIWPWLVPESAMLQGASNGQRLPQQPQRAADWRGLSTQQPAVNVQSMQTVANKQQNRTTLNDCTTLSANSSLPSSQSAFTQQRQTLMRIRLARLQIIRSRREAQKKHNKSSLKGCLTLRKCGAESQVVDKVVDQLCSYIASYDLSSLRDAWSHLDQRVFSRLESQFIPTVRKLEGGLLKMYVMNTIQTNRNDKLLEFFEKMSLELQNQPEWKEWFVLPFVKNPEENPVFSMFFTRQWQDTMLVSLHNFLSVIFQSMPLPTLLSYEEEQSKISQLMEENEMLKQRIATWQQGKGCGPEPNNYAEADNVESEANELMDDFCIIAQQEPPPTDSQQSKSIRSLIRNISSGLPTSPILGRKQQQQAAFQAGLRNSEETNIPTGKYVISRNKPRTISSPLPSTRTRVLSENESMSKGGIQSSGKPDDISQKSKAEQALTTRPRAATTSKGKSEPINLDGTVKTMEGSKSSAPFLLLSQDEYREHHSAITHCKFNASGSVIASSDVNGIIKIWSPSPSPQTIATVMSKSSVLALEWASKLERLLLLGNRSGTIRLYDIKEKKTLCEVGLEGGSLYKEQKITCLACSPTESCFICCSVGMPKVPFTLGTESAVSAFSPEGRITIWDMKAMKYRKTLNLEPSAAISNCCVFNHNGQLLLVGAVDGRIRLFDMRCDEGIATWQAHRGNAYSVQFSTDETSCYSLGEDGKFIQWSVNKTGEKMSSATFHDKAAGPFVVHPSSGSNPSIHFPAGKLFASDAEGRHVLTCAPTGGIIYSIRSEEDPQPIMSLGGHCSPVVTVDWASVMDCGTCITASMDGEIIISTLLAK